MASRCQDDFRPIYFDDILPPLCVLLSISIIPLLIIHIRAYIQKRLKASKWMNIGCVSLYVITSVKLVVSAIYYRMYCHNEEMSQMIQYFTYGLVNTQYNLVLNILFLKLWFIFRPTRYRLSKCMVRSWIAIAIFIVINFVLGISLFFLGFESYGRSAIYLLSFYTVFLLIWLNGLFVKKLMFIYKASSLSTSEQRQEDDDLLQIVTKSTLLCVVTTASLIIFSILIILWPIFAPSAHMDFILQIGHLMDTYTNYICILLANKYFNGLYRKLCGWCNDGCVWLFRNCYIKKNEPPQTKLHIQMGSTENVD